MARTVIARVRLAPSEVGYYDDLSRIHLTITSPEADVLSGMNCSHLKRGVANGTLRLVHGSFCMPEPEKKKVITPVIKEEPKPAAEEVLTDEPETEETKESAVVEVSETVEEVPKRRSRKQKTVAEPVTEAPETEIRAEETEA